MKFVHISDLHLGKRLNEYSLIEDQKYVLDEIVSVVDEERPDGVLVAGDVYDKSVPSAEAVQLFDEFLVKLSQRKKQVFVISGNHDSPERIAFGGRLMDASGVHLSPVYDGNVSPVTLFDEYGALNVYSLPFVKPSHVKRFYEEEEISSYTDGVATAIKHMRIDPNARNVLLSHQFVTGAALSGSEDEITVGGTDNVDASVLNDFDYVALGHIHGAQNCGNEKIRYSGTPLKYSFSELKHRKSVTVVELKAKGEAPIVYTRPLTPLREVREIRGTFAELTAPAFYAGKDFQKDYLRIVLTDEEDVVDGYAKLRQIYPNFAKLEYDNARTRSDSVIYTDENAEEKSAMELFCELFELQNNRPVNEKEAAFLKELIEQAEESV